MTRAPLDILYVGTLPPHQGGSAIVAAQVLTGLAARGHAIRAIAPTTRPDLEAGDPFASRRAGFEVARFAMPYLDGAPDTPPASDYRERERDQIARLTGAAIGVREPDVVVIGRESFVPHAAGWARQRGLPSIVLVQGATTMGILNGSYPQGMAERLLDGFAHVSAVVTSAHHMETTLNRLGVTGVEVVPNPVDLDRFAPGPRCGPGRHRLGIGEDQIVVMHLSNLKGLKRILDLVEAAQIALREQPRLTFVVVGEGPCRREAEQACSTRGIAGSFRFTGWVDHASVPELINAADIVAMPSAGEAQALVYLEAQACERTLIASDIPAAREVVEHERTGLLFGVGDTGDLATQIVRAAREPSLRGRLGRAARQAVQRHSLSRVTDAYVSLLEGLVGESCRQPPRQSASGAG